MLFLLFLWLAENRETFLRSLLLNEYNNLNIIRVSCINIISCIASSHESSLSLSFSMHLRICTTKIY